MSLLTMPYFAIANSTNFNIIHKTIKCNRLFIVIKPTPSKNFTKIFIHNFFSNRADMQENLRQKHDFLGACDE